MSNFDRMLVLTQEPFVGYMPDDVRGLLKEPMLDVLLASLFACVANQISCLLWDLDEGDNWAEYSYLVWEQIEEELIQQIYAILEREGKLVQRKSVGKYEKVRSFMERNGLCCPSGWWVRMDSAQENEGRC